MPLHEVHAVWDLVPPCSPKYRNVAECVSDAQCGVATTCALQDAIEIGVVECWVVSEH